MNRWYIGTDTGSKSLAHYAKGASAKDHKWVSRSLKNGHWVYKYPVTTVDLGTGTTIQGESERGQNINDWMDEGIDSTTGYPITKSTRIQEGEYNAYLDEWKDNAGKEGFTISAGFGQDLSGRYGYDEEGRPYTSLTWYKDTAPEEYEFWNSLTQGKKSAPTSIRTKLATLKKGSEPGIEAAYKAKQAAYTALMNKAKEDMTAMKTASNELKTTDGSNRAPSLDRIKKETAERKTIAARKAVQKQIQADVRNKVNAANAQKKYAELTKSSIKQQTTPSAKSHEVNSNGIKARPATALDADLFKNRSSAETKNKVNISDRGGNTGIKTEVTKKKKKRL